MRALISDIGQIGELGFRPKVDLESGIGRYLDWIATQGDLKDYFTAAANNLRKRKLVKLASGAPA